MELNDKSEDGTGQSEDGPEASDSQPVAQPRTKRPSPRGEAEVEAEVEAEIEADVAEYKAEEEAEIAVDKVRVEEEEATRDYSPPYVPVSDRDAQGQSLLRRLSPYLTAAGLLLIARIVVYSLRRRRR